MKTGKGFGYLPVLTATELAQHWRDTVVAVAAEWRQTRHGRRLLVVVGFAAPGPMVQIVDDLRSLWTPAGSAAILARVFQSDDPSTWPDHFPLPLLIAKNVRNPVTNERKDRVWVLPADLWPDAGGGTAAGSGVAGGGTTSGSGITIGNCGE
jgi:hypothetical protein